ncbi:DUF7768 domain-containing protein [Caproiciproducens faecalis]|uniref:DUF7768 domain-containing protein n=1 Tax=Caproiciproducens faecalis TaxID=2820301 RepID=A0ABS7DQS9_9FIRM|nr:DUF4406 domain-containing protein [Caproiciproducens faecalis]MBW7573170.1 hypothetical protein [Caproiciproducens faecalis]
MMKLVYICSPLKGDMQENIKKATAYCAYAAEQGVIPLAPHTIFTQYLDDTVPLQRQKGLMMGMELLKHCSELWVCGDVVSEGMKREISYAQKHDIATLYYSETFFHNQTVSHKEDYGLRMKQKIIGIQEQFGSIFVAKAEDGKITSVILPEEAHSSMSREEIKEVERYIASAGSRKPEAGPVEENTMEMEQ